MTTYYVVSNGTTPPVANQSLIIENDQNIVKGALWTFAAFKVGSLAIGAGLGTLYTSPLLVLPPFTVFPVALAISTSILASITGSCIDNAAYHLGSRKFVVVQQ